MPSLWKEMKQMRPVQRELIVSFVIIVEAVITPYALECAKRSCHPSNSTACAVR